MHHSWSTMRVRGTAALLVCAALAALTHGVTAGTWWPAVDVAAVRWAHAHGDAAAVTFMLLVSRAGGPSATSVYAAFLVIFLTLRHRYRTAVGVACVVYGGAGLNVLLKHAVHRGRPVLDEPLVNLPTYSFPSGHAAAVTIFGGLLITMLMRTTPGIRRSGPVVVAVSAWMAMVCASRVYLGAHYPSDILAGVLEGIAWLLIASVCLDALHVPLTWPTTSSSGP